MTDILANPDAFDRIRDFTTHLRKQGYAEGTITHYDRSCRHFATWLEGQSIPVAEIDKEVVSRFAQHDCNCTGFVGSRNSRYMYRIDRFVRYLASVGAIAARKKAVRPTDDDGLQGFADWLRRHRGIGEKRIDQHRQTIKRLLPQLGDDPALYNAALINRVMLENLQTMSRHGAQQMCGSLRMYLRFLVARDACPATLIGAILRIPRWRLAELPRYILSDDVERVIASCDLSTAIGLRDRAILLLLARLAMLCWTTSNAPGLS
ncbi:hypothetical protein J7363_17640 [Phaeobacter italicus]|uniref:phage integrase SAM-like domain-containing protein n=1 Tax=Phaeobacter italicus TaxID=481446 RepID=UPI001ADCAFC9|nr:phage integrase SAM-like domain-containing protein [Phaeobacter italicus]MBO9443916.1 hypothetical protein [Phaeobacter italicus]